MSRAFVKENDNAIEDYPERPISAAPNLVTETGLAAIEEEVARLRRALADTAEDADLRARLSRDLRYWSARRASAQLQAPPNDAQSVHFGSTVSIERGDGRGQTYRIVGEDEADPEAGTVSYLAPLARALLGKSKGDVVPIGAGDVEIVGIV
jgi:transcription elongation GreA/GreB family factor